MIPQQVIYRSHAPYVAVIKRKYQPVVYEVIIRESIWLAPSSSMAYDKAVSFGNDYGGAVAFAEFFIRKFDEMREYKLAGLEELEAEVSAMRKQQEARRDSLKRELKDMVSSRLEKSQ